MRKTALVFALLAGAATLAGCTPADPKDVSRYAGEIFGRLRDRTYDAVYDKASDAFKKTFTRDEFVAKMKALEGFGQMLEFSPAGDPTVTDEGGDLVARAPYATKFTLGGGPFGLTLRSNDVTGAWELDGYDYDVTATTSDPPYPPDDEGAEKLARRFLYLWQNRRYEDLSKTMRLREDPAQIADFYKKLESAGQLLTMARTSYQESGSSRGKSAAADYDLKFDNGTGTMKFKLLAVDGEWRVDKAEYSIEYFRQP